MKLALKFTLAFLVGLFVVLTTYAYFVSQREIIMSQKDMQRDQRVLGYALALAIQELWENQGESKALAFVQRANHSEAQNRVSVRWVWAEALPGSPYRPRLPEAELAALRGGEEVTWADQQAGRFGYLYSYAPVAIAGRGIGAVEIGESLKEQWLYTRATVTHIGITTGAVAAISALMATLLGLRMVGRPVDELIRRARGVAAGDLESRLRFHQHDELRELGEELNAMCERLAAARDRIATETAARLAAIEQLRHADRLKTVGQLASGIAHELGTPLNVVRARAKLIASGGDSGPEALSNAQIVVEQSDRMTSIIRQLLDFARPRSPKRMRTDLRQMAQRTLSLLASTAGKRKVAMSLAGKETTVFVDVDPDQLQQVLSNLIMNAIQAMPEGGTVTVGTRQERVCPPADHGGPEGDYLCLYVQDQGEGISAEHLPRLFEPFFTTKQVGEGSGLGLSVSRGIIKEHGGWISVASQVGQGSCFCIYLPRGATDVAKSTGG